MVAREEKSAFGIQLFVLYVSFYSGVAAYNTYLNLYLSSSGLSNPQIGGIVSLSTIFTLFTQMFWAHISDRSRQKNRIMRLLYVLAAAVSLSYYIDDSPIYLAVLVTTFAVVFNPIAPLQDNMTLELIEGSRTDFGQVRMGGTIGYSLTVLVTGFFLNDAYRHIFWLTSLFLLICWLLSFRFPNLAVPVVHKEKTDLKAVLSNKLLLGIVLFSFVFNLGLSFYYNFYPIYFVSIGGDSSIIGTLMFVGALTEIPMLLLARRIIDRIGVKKLLIVAAVATVLRWILLSFLINPALVVLTGLLHGVGFTSFSYSVITYINKVIPQYMRGRAQTLNVLLGMVIPRILSGYIGGLLSESRGTDQVMLMNAAILGLTTIAFFFVRKGNDKQVSAD